MCQTEKIKELKYLLKDIEIEFTDEEIINYIKNSMYYNEIINDMKLSVIKKYLEQVESEKEEKIKNDFLDKINQYRTSNSSISSNWLFYDWSKQNKKNYYEN